MGTTFHDLRYAVRLLTRQRLFTLLALMTLALGIGANSAIFAVVNSVLLRPLPFREPGRLVLIEEIIKKLSPNGLEVTPSDLIEYQRSSQVFDSVAGYTLTSMDLTGDLTGGQPERLEGLRVSAQIFPVLGISPVIGRGFTPAEDHPGSGVAVISYRLWQRRFRADPAVVGRTVDLDRKATTIVGVLAQDVEFPLPGLPFGGGHDVWLPLALTPEEQARTGTYNYAVVARLKPGVNLAQAQDQVRAIARRIYEGTPGLVRSGLELDAQVAAVVERVAQGSRKMLWLMAGAVGLVLFIACVNVANLLLGRAAGRERELTIRSSLGASRAQLLRQLLTESVLLSMSGGAAGLLLAAWLVTLLAKVIPASVPRAATIDLDWRVVAFTTAIALVAGLLFGAIPALMAARTGESARLNAVSRSTTSSLVRARFRSLLIVSEVTLSLVLLVGSGLLIRSLIALRAVQPGLDVQHVLTARVALPDTAYPNAASVRAFYERAVSELEAMPGASAAGASTVPLLRLRNQLLVSVRDPAVPTAIAVNATVLGDYFQAAGIQVRRGRLFDSRDGSGTEPVLIINEALAGQYFPGKEAVGQQIKLGPRTSPDAWFTVLGVVADVKNDELANRVRPEVYLPYSQLPDQAIGLGYGKSMIFAVKAAAEPAALASAVRAAVARLDPQLPVSDLETVRAQVEASLAPQWFQTNVVASFAGLALLLAAIGIYGVVSYAVTQRTQEIGVRMALGASRGTVLALVVGQGMIPVFAGVLLGMAASVALTRLMAGFLFGIQPTDWVTFLVAPAILCVVAAAANLAPARRAANVDPMVALRYE